MSKRKADIFTVAESVTNWFETNGYTVASLERPKGIVPNQHKSISEGSAPLQLALPGKLEPTAIWATRHPDTWLSVIGPVDLAKRAEDGSRGLNQGESSSRAKDGPVGPWLDDADNWSQVRQVGREPTCLVEGSDMDFVGTAGKSTVTEVAGKEGLSLHPFWALLMAVGCEEI